MLGGVCGGADVGAWVLMWGGGDGVCRLDGGKNGCARVEMGGGFEEELFPVLGARWSGGFG